MSAYDDFGDFDSPDPLVRYNAHQAAKGRAQLPDPDETRKRDREAYADRENGPVARLAAMTWEEARAAGWSTAMWETARRVMAETPLERAYRLGQGCGGLDAAGVKRLVELSRENEGLR